MKQAKILNSRWLRKKKKERKIESIVSEHIKLAIMFIYYIRGKNLHVLLFDP